MSPNEYFGRRRSIYGRSAIGSGTTRRWTRARPSLPPVESTAPGTALQERSAWRARTPQAASSRCRSTAGRRQGASDHRPFAIAPTSQTASAHPDGLPGERTLEHQMAPSQTSRVRSHLNAGPGASNVKPRGSEIRIGTTHSVRVSPAASARAGSRTPSTGEPNRIGMLRPIALTRVRLAVAVKCTHSSRDLARNGD